MQGFSTSKTDSPDIDEILFTDDQRKQEYFTEYKGWQGRIVSMSPREYIRRCRQGFASIGEVVKIESGRDRDRILKYAQQMKQGAEFPIPYLDYRRDFSQEGLHRAMAAEVAGLDRIPVAVIELTPEKRQEKQQQEDQRRKELLRRYQQQLDDQDYDEQDPDSDTQPEPSDNSADDDTQRILRMLGL